MASATNVSLIVQGPYHSNIERTVSSAAFKEVIVSTWNDGSLQGLDRKAIQERLSQVSQQSDVTVILNEYHEIPASLKAEYPSLSNQIWSTLQGVRASQSKWVVKVRSDEVWDLNGVLNALAKIRPGQMLTANWVVRDWSYHRFHISDHLFAVESKNLTRGLELLESGQSLKKMLRSKDRGTPESILGAAIFAAIISPESPESVLEHRRSSRTLWKTFSERVVILDLDKECTFFELYARRAGVGPISNLREFAGRKSLHAMALDFRLFTDVNQLFPRPRLIVWASKVARAYSFSRRRPRGNPLPLNR
jgi:hypothetical protein